MALLPKVKLKALVSFPATVIDGTGIDVVKQNGTYQFDLDFGDFAPPVAGISDATHQCALLWNSVTNSYVLAPVSLLGSGGAVPEAPNDGSQYGRQSLTWTKVVSGGTPSSTPPLMDGVAAPGVSATYSRGDHVHPSDTAKADKTYVDAQNALKAPIASPVLTGDPQAPTPIAGDNDTSIATTAFVTTAVNTAVAGATVPPATAPPLMDGAALVGAATKYAREDHVHPSDTSRQPIDDDLTAVAALTGTGIARRASATPTWTVGTAVINGELAPMGAFTFKGNNTTGPAVPGDVDIAAQTTNASPGGGDYLIISDQAASGAWKKVAISTMPGASGGIPEAPNDGQQYARQSLGWTVVSGGGGASPSGATPLMDSVGAAGTSLLYSRGDHVHPSDTSRQPLDVELTAIAGLISAADRLPYFTGSGTASLATFTSFARTVVDDVDAPTMRATLGLSAAATATPAALTKTDDANVTLTLGGTPATALLQAASITVGWTGTLSAARGGLGINASASNGVPLFAAGVPTFTGTTGTGNFARAADPVFTGNPTAPTPLPGDNDTSIATTAFVTAALAAGASVLVADTPPAGAPDKSLWWESDTGILYIRYNDGTSTQWVAVASGAAGITDAPNDGTQYGRQSQGWTPVISVRYDTTQSLTDAQKVQARSNIYAAPFDALAYNGMQVNGGMTVDQPNAGASIAVAVNTSGDLIDSWRYFNNCLTAAYTAQQVTSAFPGYANELKVTVTAAQTSLGANVTFVSTRIEGYRFVRAGWGTSAAQPVSIGLWVKSSVAGTLPLLITDGSGNNSTANVTITAANTAQFVVATFTPPGACAASITNLLVCEFQIYLAQAGTINLAATAGNTFELTGFILLPGIELPSASRAPFITRPFDQELLTSQRYYQLSGAMAGVFRSSTNIQAAANFSPMRAVPTVLLRSGTNAANIPGVSNSNITAFATGGSTDRNNGFYIDCTTNASATGTPTPGQIAAGTFAFSARL